MARISYREVPQNEDGQPDINKIPKARRVPSPWHTVWAFVYALLAIGTAWWMEVLVRPEPQRLQNLTDSVRQGDLEVLGPGHAMISSVIVPFGFCVLMNCAVAEGIYFFIYLWTEREHCSTRHEGSRKRLLLFVWNDHRRLKWLLGFSGILLFMFWVCGNLSDLSQMWMASMFSVPYLYNLLNKVPNDSELSVLAQRVPSCGADLSAQYYFGYLRLVLPLDSNCDREPSLGLRIDNFSMKNDISMPVRKLFLVLPYSCHMTTDLSLCLNDGNIKLEKVMQLDPKVLERGVNRKYDNTVYKITGYHREVYLVAELATALLTLYDMSESSTCDFLSSDNRREQFMQFCTTLDELLSNDKKCSDTYVLVYYNDADVRSSKQFLPNVLLAHFLKEEGLVDNVPHLVQDIEVV